MKNQQVYKVVMLPTEKASNIFLRPNYHLFHSIGLFAQTGQSINSEVIGQHLYITSDEEIKEGDFIYENNLNKKIKIYEVYKRNSNLVFFRFENVPIKLEKSNNAKKVNASTDKAITPSSWIPDSFVKVYIESYNNKKPITEVSLEIEECQRLEETNSFYLPKTRPEGSVIIHQSKMYSREEVKTLINNFYVDTIIDKKVSTLREKDKWIQDNL